MKWRDFGLTVLAVTLAAIALWAAINLVLTFDVIARIFTKPKPTVGVSTTRGCDCSYCAPPVVYGKVTPGGTMSSALPPGYTLHTNMLGEWACKKPDGYWQSSSYGKVYSYSEAFDARTTAVYYAWETYSNDLQTARERAARAETERKQNTWFITERGVPR